jgi:hypothetical protein
VSSHRKGEEIIFEKYCIKGKRKRKTIKLVLNLCTFTHKTAQYQTLKKRYFVYLYDINLQLCHDCCCLLQGQQQLFRRTHARVLTPSSSCRPTANPEASISPSGAMEELHGSVPSRPNLCTSSPQSCQRCTSLESPSPRLTILPRTLGHSFVVEDSKCRPLLGEPMTSSPQVCQTSPIRVVNPVLGAHE